MTLTSRGEAVPDHPLKQRGATVVVCLPHALPLIGRGVREMDRDKSMKSIALVIVLLFIARGSANGQDISGTWPGIQTMEVDHTEAGVVHFSFNPKLAEIVDNDITDNESMIKTIVVAKSRISEGFRESYWIVYSEGGSLDPMFTVYRGDNTEKPKVFEQAGLHLAIPGDGALYVSGHTNNMYDQREKYVLNEGKFAEVSQPYYYVGIKSKLKDWLSVYSDVSQKAEVARLRKGSNIEVLINKDEDYWIKTEYGLLGWVKIADGDQEAMIEGIYFKGD